ncbi:MAG: putative toxin-antitoxin system toxin component, PIN family [Thermoanaerobaculia bacterium]
MAARERVVIDTGVLISRLLLPHSVPGRAVSRIVRHGQLLASAPTFDELADVLARPKLDPYLTVAERQEFLRLLSRLVDWVPIVYRIQACRDPKDDKFLELAINGRADVIVTGDDDLLVLHPYRDTPILTPSTYLGSVQDRTP